MPLKKSDHPRLSSTSATLSLTSKLKPDPEITRDHVDPSATTENGAPPTPPSTNPGQNLEAEPVRQLLPRESEPEHRLMPQKKVAKESTLQRFHSLPDDLHFFLKPKVDLNKRPSTKANLLRIIQHFFPSYKPPAQHTKGILLRTFTEKISPLISAYVESHPDESDEDEDDTDAEMYDATEMHASQRVPSKVNLSGIDPHSPNITVDIILSVVRDFKPNVNLPSKMKKACAIAFWHKYVSPAPPGGYPAPFTAFPKPVPSPYHKHLTRDELRFSLQCHMPQLYVEITADKAHLLALYEHFVLESISDDLELCEGVDYHIRPSLPAPPKL